MIAKAHSGAFSDTTLPIFSFWETERLLCFILSVFRLVCLARSTSRGAMTSSRSFSNQAPSSLIKRLSSQSILWSARTWKNLAPSSALLRVLAMQRVCRQLLLVVARPANMRSCDRLAAVVLYNIFKVSCSRWWHLERSWLSGHSSKVF